MVHPSRNLNPRVKSSAHRATISRPGTLFSPEVEIVRQVGPPRLLRKPSEGFLRSIPEPSEGSLGSSRMLNQTAVAKELTCPAAFTLFVSPAL
jgi:hypothetical protein